MDRKMSRRVLVGGMVGLPLVGFAARPIWSQVTTCQSCEATKPTPPARMFDSDFPNSGFKSYTRLAPPSIIEGVDYGLVDDSALGTKVAWMDSRRGTTLGNNNPRVGLDTPDFILPAAHGNTNDVYWMGFSVYYPSSHRISHPDGWCTFSTGGFGPPWGGSSPTGIALVLDLRGNHVMSLCADGQFTAPFPLDQWVNVVIGYKFAYEGWLEWHMSVGPNNRDLKRIPFRGQDRRPLDCMRKNVNDAWYNDPTKQPCCTGISVYGSQVCRALFARQRVARTMEGALPFD